MDRVLKGPCSIKQRNLPLIIVLMRWWLRRHSFVIRRSVSLASLLLVHSKLCRLSISSCRVVRNAPLWLNLVRLNRKDSSWRLRDRHIRSDQRSRQKVSGCQYALIYRLLLLGGTFESWLARGSVYSIRHSMLRSRGDIKNSADIICLCNSNPLTTLYRLIMISLLIKVLLLCKLFRNRVLPKSLRKQIWRYYRYIRSLSLHLLIKRCVMVNKCGSIHQISYSVRSWCIYNLLQFWRLFNYLKALFWNKISI